MISSQIFALYPDKLEFDGMLNGKMLVLLVGNGFIRSERCVNIRGSMDGNGFLFQHFSIERASHENVTGRKVQIRSLRIIHRFSIQRTAPKSLPFGMHECIPYEISLQIPFFLTAESNGHPFLPLNAILSAKVQRKTRRCISSPFQSDALPLYLNCNNA